MIIAYRRSIKDKANEIVVMLYEPPSIGDFNGKINHSIITYKILNGGDPEIEVSKGHLSDLKIISLRTHYQMMGFKRFELKKEDYFKVTEDMLNYILFNIDLFTEHEFRYFTKSLEISRKEYEKS